MLNEEIHQLASINEAYGSESWLHGSLAGFGIEPGRRDHRALAPLGDDLAEVFHRLITDFRGTVTLGLHEQLNPGQICDIEFAYDVHAAIPWLTSNRGLLKPEGLQQGPGQFLELGGIELENASRITS